ncbi:hypothetical protein CK203_035950 [Vitis vinifera]|uniref:Uncharacterized protein n=1 Tax=Vitis vinifera TaxID=29760 RepID=A0A438I035_VITVI|nr:hypothetical protein CK203_035950 [Vitis vinifera]
MIFVAWSRAEQEIRPCDLEQSLQSS